MFDLLTAHSRLGLTDASKDYYVNLGIATALAIAERYCDRHFYQATETEKFYYVSGQALQISRYPLISVTSIKGSDGSSVASSSYKVNMTTGQILFGSWFASQEVDVTYTGGYTALPLDLELALWEVFDAVWAATPGAGAVVGGGAATGGISSISVPDVGTLRFDTGKTSSSNSASGSGGFISDYAIGLLEPYRLKSC
jgi:hypothetical protein